MRSLLYQCPDLLVSCHNHSNWSDGAGDLKEVCRKGKEAGLKILGMSDHYVVPPGDGYNSETWSMKLSRLDEYIEVLSGMRRELEDDSFSLKIGLEVDFFFENIDVFGGSLPDSWNALYYPVVHSMIGLQLLVLGCALIAKNLIRGAEGLLKGKPVAESVMVLITAITVIYDIAHCWIKVETAPRMYSFPLLIAVFLILLFDMFNVRREIYGFNIVASKRSKFTLMKLDEEV